MAFQGFKAAGKEDTPSFVQAAYGEAKLKNEEEAAKQQALADMIRAGFMGGQTYNTAMGDKTPIADYFGRGDTTEVNPFSATGAPAAAPAESTVSPFTAPDTPAIAPDTPTIAPAIPPTGADLPADAITPDTMQGWGAGMVEPSAAAEGAGGSYGGPLASLGMAAAGGGLEANPEESALRAAAAYNPYTAAALMAYDLFA